MSGPKISAWEVEQNRLREKLARDDAATRAARLRRSLETSCSAAGGSADAEVAAFADLELPVVVTGISSLRAIEAYENTLLDMQASVNAAFDRADNRRATAAFLAGIVAAAGDTRQTLGATSRADATTSTVGENSRAIVARVERLRAAVPGTTPPAVKRSIDSASSAVMSAVRDADVSVKMATLNALVDDAVSSARRVARGSAEARRLIRKLHGLRGDDVESLKRTLERVESGELPFSDSLRDRVEQVAAAAAHESDQTYVATVLTQSLERLGYDVDEGFNTLTSNEGVVYASRRQRGYGVRMAMAPGKSLVDVEIVRFDQDADRSSREQVLLDTAAEEAFCSDYETVLASAREAGVACRTVRRLKPGERPMPVVRRKRAADQARRAETPKARRYPSVE